MDNLKVWLYIAIFIIFSAGMQRYLQNKGFWNKTTAIGYSCIIVMAGFAGWSFLDGSSLKEVLIWAAIGLLGGLTIGVLGVTLFPDIYLRRK